MRKITREDMRRVYGEASEAVTQSVGQTLRTLPVQEDAPRRIGYRLAVLAMAMVLLAGIALAAGTWLSLGDWLGGVGGAKTQAVGQVIAETDEVTFTLTEAAMYGDMLIIAVHEQPKQPGQLVCPTMNIPYGVKWIDQKKLPDLLDASMRTVGFEGLDADTADMPLRDYLAQTGLTPVWARVDALPVFNALALDGMSASFTYPQEDGSVMSFSVSAPFQPTEDEVKLYVAYGSMTDETMASDYGYRPRAAELQQTMHAKHVEVDVSALRGGAPQKTADAVEWTVYGGQVTVRDLQLYAMPFGWTVRCEVQVTGERARHIVNELTFTDGEGVPFEMAGEWEETEEGWHCSAFCYEKLFFHEERPLPDELTLSLRSRDQTTTIQLHDVN